MTVRISEPEIPSEREVRLLQRDRIITPTDLVGGGNHWLPLNRDETPNYWDSIGWDMRIDGFAEYTFGAGITFDDRIIPVEINPSVATFPIDFMSGADSVVNIQNTGTDNFRTNLTIGLYTPFLKAYWEMEENGTDDRLDSVGTNDASPWDSTPSTLGSRVGKNKIAAELDNGGIWLNVPDAADVSPSTGFAYSMWVYNDGLNPTCIVNKTESYYLWEHVAPSTRQCRLRVYTSAVSYVEMDINNIAVLPVFDIGAWVHVFFGMANNDIFLYKNGVDLSATGAFPGTIHDSTNDVQLGKKAVTELNGAMDEVPYWNDITFTSVVARDDLAAALYNAGAGRFWNPPAAFAASLYVQNNIDFDGILTSPNTGLHILDTDASHDLIIKPGSNLSADRTLTFTTGDADRTITLQGNPTLDDWFDQSVKQAASPTFAGLTISDGGSISLQEDITFTGATTENLIKMPDNLADALSIQEGANKYVTFDTIDGEEDIIFFIPLDIRHTALSADDHSLEIDTDAAGFGDVKAIDIQYITRELEAGEDEGIILINIDDVSPTEATGGEVFGIEVLATDGNANKFGFKVGPGVGAIHQDSGTFANPTTGTDNTPSTDVAAMIDGNIATTTAIFEADDEYIIMGAATASEAAEIVLTTLANVNIKPTFWYSTVGTHQFTEFFPVDGTDGMKHTGVVSWDASDLVGHVADDVTLTFDYMIIRTKNNVNTTPVLGYMKLAATTEFIWDKDGDVNINTLATVGAITQAGTTLALTYHPLTTVGIADNNLVEIDDAAVADNMYTKFTGVGVEGRSYSEVLADLSGQAGAGFDWGAQALTNIGSIATVGNVGIGTSSAQRDLHIESGVPTIRMSDDNAATDLAVATLIEFYRGNNTNRVGFLGMESSSNNNLKIATDYAAGQIQLSTGNSVTALTIDNAQNVGIGLTTIDANYKLIVRRAADINLGIGLQGAELAIAAFNDALSANVPMRFYASEFNLLNGFVGIGVTDPSAKLEVFYAGDQLTLSFDATENAVFDVDVAGVLTITPSGAAVDFASKNVIGIGDLVAAGTTTFRAIAYTWPVADAAGVLTSDGGGALTWGAAGAGDVTAAANMGDNEIVRGDGGAKGVQDTPGVTLSDAGNLAGVGTIGCGAITSTGNSQIGGASSVTGIGTAPTASRTLFVYGDFASGYTLQLWNDGNNANRYGIVNIAGADDGSGTTFYMTATDGNGSTTGYLQTIAGVFQLTDISDERLKDKVFDSDMSGRDIIMGLKVRDFEYKKLPGVPQVGFVAQEVREVYPRAVSEVDERGCDWGEDEDGKKIAIEVQNPTKILGTSKSELIAPMIKYMQELEARVAALELN